MVKSCSQVGIPQSLLQPILLEDSKRCTTSPVRITWQFSNARFLIQRSSAGTFKRNNKTNESFNRWH